jgi:mRNA interferase ChpB
MDDDPASIQTEKNPRFFMVITSEPINLLGISMMVPITRVGSFAKKMGLTVPVLGNHTEGVAVCNQVRSFDVQGRVQLGQARYVESLDKNLVAEIVNRVLSVIEPAEAA